MLVVQRVGGCQVWIAINSQARKSIDESLSHSQKFRLMLSLELLEYEKMPEARKVASKYLLLGCNGGRMKGFSCKKIPATWTQRCPSTNRLSIIRFYWWVILDCLFPKTVGLILAIEVLPNTSYFFAVAADSQFFDPVFTGKTIYSCKGDGLRMSFPNETGLEGVLVDNCLVTRWALGNTLLTVKDLIGNSVFPTRVFQPQRRQITGWCPMFSCGVHEGKMGVIKNINESRHWVTLEPVGSDNGYIMDTLCT
jgi:hypothetical protein